MFYLIGAAWIKKIVVIVVVYNKQINYLRIAHILTWYSQVYANTTEQIDFFVTNDYEIAYLWQEQSVIDTYIYIIYYTSNVRKPTPGITQA